MPRRETELLFSEPGEWTARKHAILGRYVVPAVPKLQRFGFLSLVDGYAGPGEYMGERGGSTQILLEAVAKARLTPSQAKVFACEADPGRFQRLTQNYTVEAAQGQLIAVNSEHGDSVKNLLNAVPEGFALVFLDPQTATQLEYERDLLPWLRRPKTDVLGVFMSTQACRIAGAAAVAPTNVGQVLAATKVFSDYWKEATTEEGAVILFTKLLQRYKRYVGVYQLRKRDSQQRAYAFFGASDSGHGLKLLSDAVARDLGLLRESDQAQAQQDSLFGDEESETDFQRLVDIVKPVVTLEPKISGKDLSVRIHSNPATATTVFGAYIESDYTKARNKVRESL